MCYISLGGIALDPSHFKSSNTTARLEAELLHKACVDVGVWVGTLQPDLIVLSTPHGIADLNNFAFYLNSMVRLVMIDNIRDFCLLILVFCLQNFCLLVLTANVGC
jgi:hypothetical protein